MGLNARGRGFGVPSLPRSTECALFPVSLNLPLGTTCSAEGQPSEFGFPDGRIHTKRGTFHKVNALLRTYPYHGGKHAATICWWCEHWSVETSPAKSHPMKSIPKIVSGGQTGADRAALDWALEHGLMVPKHQKPRRVRYR